MAERSQTGGQNSSYAYAVIVDGGIHDLGDSGYVEQVTKILNEKPDGCCVHVAIQKDGIVTNIWEYQLNDGSLANSQVFTDAPFPRLFSEGFVAAFEERLAEKSRLLAVNASVGGSRVSYPAGLPKPPEKPKSLLGEQSEVAQTATNADPLAGVKAVSPFRRFR